MGDVGLVGCTHAVASVPGARLLSAAQRRHNCKQLGTPAQTEPWVSPVQRDSQSSQLRAAPTVVSRGLRPILWKECSWVPLAARRARSAWPGCACGRRRRLRNPRRPRQRCACGCGCGGHAQTTCPRLCAVPPLQPPKVKLLIDGQFVDSTTDSWIDVVNPATQARAPAVRLHLLPSNIKIPWHFAMAMSTHCFRQTQKFVGATANKCRGPRTLAPGAPSTLRALPALHRTSCPSCR